MRRCIAWLALGAASMGCAATCPTQSGQDGGAVDAANGDVLFGDVSSDDSGSNGCSERAKLVYVISNDGVLHSFAPPTLSFTTIGKIACNTTGTPESMAVSRDGTAWVHMNGMLWKVSTLDASCQPTAYQGGQLNRVIHGMGMSSDTAQGTSETLFVSTTTSGGGGGLAKLDLSTFQLSLVGDFTNGLGGRRCVLTGTGNAVLFGFFDEMTATPMLAEIDKTSGATPNPTVAMGVFTTSGYAFSFWGGDFWFYTRNGTGTGSTVTRYKYATDKTYVTALYDTGFVIVGAGVSTCAPLTPPN